MILAACAIAAGLGLLAFAPDRFVSGAAGLADHWGLSRVLIGAVVIGFGTSTPELLVSTLAAAGGDPEVGVGNVIGSNLANLALVVPVAALIAPMRVPPGLLRSEVPLMAVATVAFAVAVQGGLTRLDGGFLLVGLVASMVAIVRRGSRPVTDAGDVELAGEVAEFFEDEVRLRPGRLAVMAVIGLVGTVVGAQLLVSGALTIADRVGLSGGFVGLTLVAIGTSLPELVTAVASARAGEHELVLGNVVGSNLLNALGVGAAVALVGPGPLDTRLTVAAVALMLVVTAAAVVVLRRGRTVSRPEAIFLLVAYLATLPLLAG